MPDYTYLQVAQPTTAGHWLLSFAHPALRDLERLEADLAWVNRSPAGAGGVNGSRFAIDRERLSDLLGLRRADRAHARRDVADRRADRGRLARRHGRHERQPARRGPRALRQRRVRAHAHRRRAVPRERADAAEAQPLRARGHPRSGRHAARPRRRPARHAAHAVRADRQPALRLRGARRRAWRWRRARSRWRPRPPRASSSTARRRRAPCARATRSPPTSPTRSASPPGSTTAAPTTSSAAPSPSTGPSTRDALDAAAQELLGRGLDLSDDALADALDPERAIASRTVLGGAAPEPMDRHAAATAAPRSRRHARAWTPGAGRSTPPSGRCSRAASRAAAGRACRTAGRGGASPARSRRRARCCRG